MLRVLTDVYPPHIKPVRDGWYLTGVYLEYGMVLREFRHGSWRYSDGTAVAPGYSHHWRGIAFNPAAAEERFSAMRITDDGPVSLGVFLPGAKCC